MGGGEGESVDDATDEGAGGTKDVRVKVLVKRGNKHQTIANASSSGLCPGTEHKAERSS